MTFYYALVDENRMLCVDQVADSSNHETGVARLAVTYPNAIYFKVDNRVPEFRVPS